MNEPENAQLSKEIIRLNGIIDVLLSQNRILIQEIAFLKNGNSPPDSLPSVPDFWNGITNDSPSVLDFENGITDHTPSVPDFVNGITNDSSSVHVFGKGITDNSPSVADSGKGINAKLPSLPAFVEPTPVVIRRLSDD